MLSSDSESSLEIDSSESIGGYALMAPGCTSQSDSSDSLVAEESAGSMAQRRKKADDLAKHCLGAGGRITHSMAWKVLSLWVCKRHMRRKNVRPDGETIFTVTIWA